MDREKERRTMNILEELKQNNLITPPDFVAKQLQYLVYTGSVAYGVSNDLSDMDVYGFCIPPKDMVFPHLRGEIQGFGNQVQRFDQYQQHHIEFKKKEYDITVYSIIKFFQLCMENNPNMVDVLFVPRRCIIYTSQVGELLRENRHIFLHKGAWHKFKGYAFAQMKKLKNKKPIGKRLATVEKYGYDVKFAYHIVRLLNEIEQILIEGDLDLERNREQLKSIRRGDWTLAEVEEYFQDKEKYLEEIQAKSELPHSPDEDKIKTLLVKCLTMHFGSLDGSYLSRDIYQKALNDIQAVIQNIS